MDKVIVNFPNDGGYSVFISNFKDWKIKFHQKTGDSIFFWNGDMLCSVHEDDWVRIKEYLRNDKIDDLID